MHWILIVALAGGAVVVYKHGKAKGWWKKVQLDAAQKGTTPMATAQEGATPNVSTDPWYSIYLKERERWYADNPNVKMVYKPYDLWLKQLRGEEQVVSIEGLGYINMKSPGGIMMMDQKGRVFYH